MTVSVRDIWDLVKGRPQIDPDDLAHAVEERVAAGEEMDYRTRLLIRDSVAALKGYWGALRVKGWLARSPVRERIEAICREDFERPGFPSIQERLMPKTDREDLLKFFRDLGDKVRHRVRIAVGGSTALIVPGHLSRATDDIDVVNEVPKEIRSQPGLLDELRQRYGLLLTHFQSHYLPTGWDQRLHYLDTFGDMAVYLVDVYDVVLSKLFSIRTKDLDDLRAVLPQLDKNTLIQRFKDTTAAMLASEDLGKRAVHNWYILYGEPLPQ